LSSPAEFNCRGKYESVKAAERMMWIGYVGAGAFAGAGAALLLLAPSSRQPGVWSQRCVPTLATAGLACAWSF
jgi:hypothetical protein